MRIFFTQTLCFFSGVNKPGPPLKGTLGRSSVRSLMANWEGRPPVQPRSKLPVPTPNAATVSAASTPLDQTESTSPIGKSIF